MFTILNEKNFKIFQEDLVSSISISLDIETNSLDVFTSKLILVQIKLNNNIYILEAYKERLDFLKEIVLLLKNSNKVIIIQNAKFDAKTIFVKTGIMLTNLFDTMLAEALLTRGIGKNFYSLQELVYKYCQEDILKEERDNFINFNGEVSQEMLIYAARDVEFLEQISKLQYDSICNLKMEKVLELEMKLIPAVAEMEINGVLLDKEKWRKLEVLAKNKLDSLKEKLLDCFIENFKYDSANVHEFSQEIRIPIKRKKDIELLSSITDLTSIKSWVRENINLNSPIQIKAILNKLGIKVGSTNEKVLNEYRNSSKIVDLLLLYREQSKKVSAYGEKFLGRIHPVTGRIHSNFNQLGTVSGRFSSDMQQVPREKEYREAFISREGYELLSLDYNQQEYRLAGSISKEKAIIQAYLEGKDMHTKTAEILSIERSKAKSINFGILYGSTDYGLSYNLGIPLDKTREILYNFKKAYPTLMLFKEKVEKFILKNKYSITPLGRKRFFEEIILYGSPKEYQRVQGRICREGFNHIIQGAGADIIKQAMVDIYYSNIFGEDLKMLMQMHDELILEIRKGLEDKIIEFVRDKLLRAEQAYLGEIPAVVNYSLGNCWSKA